MKVYILIITFFMCFLTQCSKQSIAEKSIFEVKKETCPCSVNNIIYFEELEIDAICYFPYKSTRRLAGLTKFYEYEITNCKGEGVVRTLNSKGEIIKVSRYKSTDSIKYGYSSSMLGDGTDTVRTVTYYPQIILEQ